MDFASSFQKTKLQRKQLRCSLCNLVKINYFSLTYHTNNLLPNKLKTNN